LHLPFHELFPEVWWEISPRCGYSLQQLFFLSGIRKKTLLAPNPFFMRRYRLKQQITENIFNKGNNVLFMASALQN
jgi:hypothetical protein